MSDTNVHRVVGNLLVGTSHFFVDTTTNQVGVNTSTPGAALDVQGGDVKVGSGITLASSTGTITATGFSGNGSGLSGVNSDSGSWVNGSSSNIHLAVSTDKVGIGTATPMTKLDIECNTAQPSIVFSEPSNSRYQTGIGSIHISGQGQRLDFYTGDSGANGTLLTNSPRMSITGTGNVGIGTDEPETLFQIGSKAAATGVNYLKIRGNNTSTFSDICGIIFNNSSIASLDGLRGESKIINERAVNNYGSTLAFYTNPADAGTGGTGVDSVKRMVIDNDGNVGIGTTSPHGVLDVRGVVTISPSSSADSYATKEGYMAAGSLNIGSVGANFGGGTSGWTTNTAGLMLECADNTEIAVHDSGERVASLMYFQGGSTNTITIGRDMGWGKTKTEFGESAKRNHFFHPSAWSYNTTSTSDTTLWSFTYNFPYDGYVILNTNGHWRNTSVHTWFYGKLGIDNADPADTSGFYDSYTGGAQSSHGGDFHEYEENASYWCDFNWGGTLKVSAGNRAIGLRVRISGGHLYINGTAINMFYIPTKIF